MKSKISHPRTTASLSTASLGVATLLLALAGPLPSAAQGGAGGGADPGGVPAPGQPPGADCSAQCDAILQKALQACAQPDGQLDSECVAAVKTRFDVNQCVADCDARNGGADPAVLACQSTCYDTYTKGLQACIDANGNIVSRTPSSAVNMLPAAIDNSSALGMRRILCDVLVRGTATKARCAACLVRATR